jgi:hypothetical protein
MSLSEQPRRHARSSATLQIVGGTQYDGCEEISAERALQQERSPKAEAFPDVLFAVLSWIAAEFLAACAHYAQGMLLIPASIHEAVDVVEPAEPGHPAGTVTDRASHHQ